MLWLTKTFRKVKDFSPTWINKFIFILFWIYNDNHCIIRKQVLFETGSFFTKKLVKELLFRQWNNLQRKEYHQHHCLNTRWSACYKYKELFIRPVWFYRVSVKNQLFLCKPVSLVLRSHSSTKKNNIWFSKLYWMHRKSLLISNGIEIYTELTNLKKLITNNSSHEINSDSISLRVSIFQISLKQRWKNKQDVPICTKWKGVDCLELFVWPVY